MHPFHGKPYYIIQIEESIHGNEPYWNYDRKEMGALVDSGEHRLATKHFNYGSYKPSRIWEYLLQEIDELGMLRSGGFMLNDVPVRTQPEARAVVAEILNLDEEVQE